MKLEVYLLKPDGGRITIWSDEDYKPQSKGGASAFLNEAVDFAVKTVFVNFFKGPFAISLLPISASAGVIKQRVKCSGSAVLIERDNGGVPFAEDESKSVREFEVELRVDAESLKLKALSGVRIARIAISNLRSLKSVTIEFRQGNNLVLMAGLNGSGKTSVLEAVAHAFLKDDIGSEIRPLAGDDYDIRINFVDDTNDEYIVERTPTFHILRASGGKIIADTRYELRRIFADVNIVFFSSWRVPISMRLAGSAGRTHKLPNGIANLERGCINDYMSSFFHRGGHPKGYLAKLNALWRRFYPEDKSEFIVGEKKSTKTQESTGIYDFGLLLTGRGDSAPITLFELSSGELELLAFVGELLIRSRPAEIVLIDEPELHLNRVWHRTVLDAIGGVNPGSQFLVATHAPEIWDSVYSWSRVFLPVEGGAR